MTGTDALLMLIELAEKASDERARSLGHALRRETSDHQRLTMLIEYRGEYLERYSKLCREGISTVGMRNFQQFLTKLDMAISQQESAHAHSQSATASARTALHESERKRQSFVVLRARKFNAESIATAKREQKQHDEWAIQQRRGNTHFSGNLE
jgi:flagellar protein FliJ